MQNLLRKLGPGLLFAGAAIGVSHLVQSTRAGAGYGWYLLWAVVIANLFKFPFFEFGPRYAMATGESLIHGYKRQGTWVLVAFLIVSILTVFTVQAAVTVVTAAIAQYLFPIGDTVLYWSAIILVGCLLVLAVGQYAVLDKLIKFIIIFLSASTLAALFIAVGHSEAPANVVHPQFDWGKTADVLFLIGLMGWMPAPIDLSVWHSIWALEKKKLVTDFSFRDSLRDFNIGYVGAALLAVAFLALGVYMMYYPGAEFPVKPAAFANTLIGMYSGSLGVWAKGIIGAAALTTMFSTTITCLDAIPRVFAETLVTLGLKTNKGMLHWGFMFLLIIGSLLLIGLFTHSMVGLVQLATILSFMTAPFFAIANYLLITGKHTPEANRPGIGLKVLSGLGIIYLVGFGILFAYVSL